MKKGVLNMMVGLLLAAGATGSQGGDDFQVWLSGSVSTDLTETWSMKGYSESWFVDDASTHRLYNLDVGFTHKTSEHLRLGIHVRQQQVRAGSQWLNENRLHGHATLLWTWKGLSFADRNRIEGRFREKRDDIVRYRNRLKVTLPAITDDGSLKPYLFNEVFIDSDQGEYNQNRLAVGLNKKVAPHLSVSPYYLLRSVDVGEWGHAHVLGVHASAKF